MSDQRARLMFSFGCFALCISALMMWATFASASKADASLAKISAKQQTMREDCVRMLRDPYGRNE